ncbi:MAG TPA: glycine cleavage system protein GcvH [Actinobacteria bacterium]|nr:glycine cleavage system protein GcvH [Actinomycetota bacterium]
MTIPEHLRYAENHEWAELRDDGTVRVGITDYAQDQLGDVVYVELPEVGRVVEAGEAFAEVESTKSVAEVYAPVAGTVVEVNEALDERPELVNADPYGEGWFAVIEPTEGADLSHLMDAEAYAAAIA